MTPSLLRGVAEVGGGLESLGKGKERENQLTAHYSFVSHTYLALFRIGVAETSFPPSWSICRFSSETTRSADKGSY